MKPATVCQGSRFYGRQKLAHAHKTFAPGQVQSGMRSGGRSGRMLQMPVTRPGFYGQQKLTHVHKTFAPGQAQSGMRRGGRPC